MSCASSTWSLPSLVRARWAKMSRISAVRSMTRTSERPREVPLLDRRQGVVGDQEPGAQSPRERPHLLHLALPEVEARVALAALLDDAGQNFGAGGLGERLSSSMDSSTSQRF